MKKLLGLLGATSLVAVSSATVIACGPKEDTSFKIPPYPKTEHQAKELILDVSNKLTQTLVELEKINDKIEELEQNEQQNAQEIEKLNIQMAQLGIDQNYMENSYIQTILLFELKRLNPDIDKVEIWQYDSNYEIYKDMVNIDELIIQNLDIKFSDLDLLIEETDLNDPEFENLSNVNKYLQNLNNIRQWWLKGIGLKSLRLEFNSYIFEVKEEDIDNKELLLEKIIELSNNNEINSNDIMIMEHWKPGSGDMGEIIIKPIDNSTYIGTVEFKYKIIDIK